MKKLLNVLMRSRLSKYAAVLAAVALVANIAMAAQFDVDNFDTDAQTSDLGTPCTTVTGTDMIGGERNIEVVRTSGAGTVQADVDTSVANSFAFSVGASTQGTGTIQLDGADGSCVLNPTGLGGISLNPYDGLSLFIREVDLDAIVTLRVYTDGSNYSSFSYTIPYGITSPGKEIYFPFDQFTDTGTGADFANVGAIEVVADGTTINSLDMTIDFVSSDFTRDYGDLPTAYANTVEADDGARHIVGGFFLGATVDTETDGQESPDLLGDAARTTDEDGVMAVSGADWGDGGGELAIETVRPNISTNGCVVGWIDWDGNDTFDATSSVGGVSELVVNQPVGAGTVSVNITTPTTADYGGTYPITLNSRFRIFQRDEPLFTTYGLPLDFNGCPTGATTADLMQLVTGEAGDGEVEDHQFSFSPTAVTVSNSTADAGTNNPIVWAVAAVIGLLLTSGVVAVRRRS